MTAPHLLPAKMITRIIMKKRVSQMDEFSPLIEGAQLEAIAVSLENMMSYLGCSGNR